MIGNSRLECRACLSVSRLNAASVCCCGLGSVQLADDNAGESSNEKTNQLIGHCGQFLSVVMVQCTRSKMMYIVIDVIGFVARKYLELFHKAMCLKVALCRCNMPPSDTSINAEVHQIVEDSSNTERWAISTRASGRK